MKTLLRYHSEMKECFKCGQSKDINLFYKHPNMLDGHLGKCIECTKSDVAKRIESKRFDPEWVKKERERCRVKAPRYRHSFDKALSDEAKKRWAIKNKHKRLAHSKAKKAIESGLIYPKTSCESCGEKNANLHKHHHDYSKPLEVTFLCTKCHGLEHRKKTLFIERRKPIQTPS
jgi:hypothetical protein